LNPLRRGPHRRRSLVWLFGLPFALLLTVSGVGCLFSGPHYNGPSSDHFTGRKFVTPNGLERPGPGGLIKWMFHRNHGTWGPYRDAPPGPRPPTRVADGRMRVTFVNHATTLIQMDGLNILTDPIWAERCSPVGFAGPKRVRPPGIRFEDLPPIDVVVISHNHYDHMDLEVLKRLAREHKPRFCVGLGNGALLRNAGVDAVTELDWWQSVDLVPGVKLFSVPSEHFSNRGLFDQDATLWTGYAVQGPSGVAYFAGDTAFGGHYAQIRERLGSPRLAVLPIGAFKPEWFMGPVHMSPRQALQAHRILNPGTSVAMHFGTFDLADDGETEAPELLKAALAESPPPTPFLVLGFGEGYDVPPQPPPIVVPSP
jgi:L-ascorbate metabolism protein UlaG (beta-lactamase superfamily)